MKLKTLALFSLISLVAACGGGGGGSSAPAATNPPPGTGGGTGGTPPPAPSPGADIIKGVITGFGSIFIDGVRFDTSDATFSKDDDSATQDDLRVGMVVEMVVSLDDNTASAVKFEEDIKGPVDAINGNELTVLGQTVQIVPETVVDNNLDLNTLVAGDIVEVSGLRGAGDVLEASFIESKNGANVNAYKVIGVVRDLDTTAQTFRVGGLTINYSTAVVDDNLGTLSDGQEVEVKDSNKAYSPGDFTLIATKIEAAGVGAGGNNNGAGGRISIQGLISNIIDTGSFELSGTTVRHNSSTLFSRGDVTLLSMGTKVQVTGIRADDGSIDATKIQFSRNSARIEGIVEGTDLDAGTFTVLGITIEPRDNADFEDKQNNNASFSLEDLSAGDFVEVRGNSTGDRIFASEVERDDADDTRVRGPVANIDADARSLSILGVQIVTAGNTQYEDLDDNIITADAFFAILREGQTLVQAKWNGSVTDPSVAVKELSLED